MYFTLVLQLLSFVGVQGKMLQCIVGGVDESNCHVLLNGSVLEKYYISSVGKTCKENISLPHEEDEEFDIPYKEFITPQNANLLGIGSSSFDEYLSPNTILQPYKLNNTDKSKNFIANSWQDVLKTGTDVIRLKFHSKLVLMYKKSYQFSPLERMVFLRSCYSAASIYYYAKRPKDALSILKDGIKFVKLLKYESNQAKNENIIEIVMWSVLYLTFKIEIKKTMSNTNIEKDSKKLLFEQLSLFNLKNKEVNGKYPSSYVLLYRQYFLDEDFDQIKKNFLFNVVKSNLLLFTNEEHPDHMYVSKYNSLVSSLVNPSDENIKGLASFMHLVDVIRSPIICTEDRLLNYKAMELAKRKIEVCFEGNENNNDLCNELKKNKQFNQDLKRILINLIREISYSNINLTFVVLKINNEYTIDENLLHNIVTSTINMNIDINSKTSETKIGIINKSIEQLKSYIEFIGQEIEFQVKMNNSIINGRIEYHKSYIIAQNWLTELYGLLCNNAYSNSNEYCLKLDENIRKLRDDEKIRDNYRASGANLPLDNHLMVLLSKHLCNSANQLYSWENTLRPVGWNIQKHTSIMDKINCKECINHIKKLTKYIGFLNPIEAWIYIFRSQMSLNEFYNAKHSLQMALKIPVVTCEDRYRNYEASELYSMTFITHNYYMIDNE